MLKTIGIFSVPGREGRHLLGQSLRSTFPLFGAPFGFPSQTLQQRGFHGNLWSQVRSGYEVDEVLALGVAPEGGSGSGTNRDQFE